MKKGRGSQSMVSTSSSNSSIKGEIGNMLEDFKSEMLQTLALQMDTIHIKRKQEEAERALAIFFLDAPRGILGMNVHWNPILKQASRRVAVDEKKLLSSIGSPIQRCLGHKVK